MRFRIIVSAGLLVLVIALLAVPSGYDEQTQALGNLARAGGYQIKGVPVYEGGRWTLNTYVEECSGGQADVTLAAESAPQEAVPTQYTVLAVEERLLEEVAPNADGRLLTALALIKIPEVREVLGCE